MKINLSELVKKTKPLRLLYVEDNAHVREATISFFDSFFDTIYVANNGKEALDIFSKEPVDIIISDINMPEMNGLEMAEMIKKEKESLPVLFLSAHDDKNFFLSAIKLGIDGYLLKPISLEQFSDVIIKVVNNIQREKELIHKNKILDEYKEAVDQSAIVSKTDNRGIITYANDAFVLISGLSREELIGKNHNVVRHPDMPKEIFKELWSTIKQKKPWHGVVKNMRKGGGCYYVDTYIHPILDEDSQITEYIAIRYDITHIKEIEERLTKELNIKDTDFKSVLRRFRLYEEAINEADILSRTDKEGIITYANDAFFESIGYSRHEIIGMSHRIIRHPDVPDSFFKEMWETITQGNIWKGVFKNVKKDGTDIYVDTLIVPITDEEGEVMEYMSIRHDITELIKSKEALKESYLHDSMTGLGNRNMLLEDIKTLSKAALLIFDISAFKEINDFYGNEIGDATLLKVVEILKKKFFRSKGIYRIHGDEFGVLCESFFDKEELVEYVRNFVKEVNENSYKINHYDIHLRLSSGISFEEDNTVITADIAHKLAKKENSNLVVYDSNMQKDKEYENNLLWTHKIKQALKENRIKAFYQPIFNNKTGAIDKYETLMRLIEPDGKEVSPYFFLEIAKKARLYKRLTRRMVEQAFDMFSNKPYSFSINITAEDIIQHGLSEYIFDLAAQKRVSNRLILELVESEGIENFSEVEDFLKKAKACHIRIAIDDFGTGYSNFEYLLKLKADYVKIDGSLIKSIDSDQEKRKIVETIVDFAKKSKMQTVAEFVSSEAIQHVIKTVDIDYSQGFFHGKPSSEVIGWTGIL